MADNLNNDTPQDDIPAAGELDLDTAETTSDLYSDTTEDDISTRTYQHDLDYKDSDTDPIIDEETENPADELGIPEGEYKEELDNLGDEDMDILDDDIRETLEDLDEDDDNGASASQ